VESGDWALNQKTNPGARIASMLNKRQVQGGVAIIPLQVCFATVFLLFIS
jgi:hypothetical protein